MEIASATARGRPGRVRMTAVEIPISTPITISDGSQSRNGATSTPSFGSPATTKTAIAMINAVRPPQLAAGDRPVVPAGREGEREQERRDEHRLDEQDRPEPERAGLGDVAAGVAADPGPPTRVPEQLLEQPDPVFAGVRGFALLRDRGEREQERREERECDGGPGHRRTLRCCRSAPRRGDRHLCGGDPRRRAHVRL